MHLNNKFIRYSEDKIEKIYNEEFQRVIFYDSNSLRRRKKNHIFYEKNRNIHNKLLSLLRKS
jgi:hypothetical protein